MAFDYGTKRIGVAVTDPLKIIATSLETVPVHTIFTFITEYLKKSEVELFVVGNPKQMDNSPSESAPHVKGFVKSLKKQFPLIPIELIDERFTSKMAEQTILKSGLKKIARQNKSLTDSVSATIILQSYMEKIANGF